MTQYGVNPITSPQQAIVSRAAGIRQQAGAVDYEQQAAISIAGAVTPNDSGYKLGLEDVLTFTQVSMDDADTSFDMTGEDNGLAKLTDSHVELTKGQVIYKIEASLLVAGTGIPADYTADQLRRLVGERSYLEVVQGKTEMFRFQLDNFFRDSEARQFGVEVPILPDFDKPGLTKFKWKSNAVLPSAAAADTYTLDLTLRFKWRFPTQSDITKLRAAGWQI